jgi:hypothetical protein
MANRDLLLLAQQGDAKAIASLLSEHLQAQVMVFDRSEVIAVAVQRQQAGLQVMLESDSVLDQEWATEAVSQLITRLAIPDLRTVKLFARHTGDRAPAWSQSIRLPDALPDKLVDLRHLAQQGNRAAMTRLLNQAIAHKQITAVVSQQESTLNICLSAPTVPNQQISLALIARELKYWQLPEQTLLSVCGQVTDADLADWQQVIPLDHLSLSPVPASSRALVSSPTESCDQADQTSETLSLPLQKLDQASRKAIGAGLFLSLLLIVSEQLAFFFSYLVVVVHELGHTVCA